MRDPNLMKAPVWAGRWLWAAEPKWSAEVVPDPDAMLADADVTAGAIVATADSGVLDRCGEWVSLARTLVEVGVPRAFVVDLR